MPYMTTSESQKSNEYNMENVQWLHHPPTSWKRRERNQIWNRSTTRRQYGPCPFPVHNASSLQNITKKTFKFRYFPNNTKNPQKQNGCFISQDTSSNGKTFSVNSSLYIDDGIFLLATQHKAEQTAQLIYDHLDRFGLQMHVALHQTKDLKLKQCSSPPPSLKQKKQTESEIPDIMLNKNKNNIHFTSSFKYLGAFLTPDLTEDTEIEARTNKASS